MNMRLQDSIPCISVNLLQLFPKLGLLGHKSWSAQNALASLSLRSCGAITGVFIEPSLQCFSVGVLQFPFFNNGAK